MEELTNSYFCDITPGMKIYWLKNIPFIDDREKHIFILLMIGNDVFYIANRLGIKVEDVINDRENLFKKIQLLSCTGILNSIHEFITDCKKEEEKKNDPLYSVYSLTFPDGKVYIGLSCDPTKRWSNGHGYKTNTLMHEAIKECGWDNVDKEILYSDLSHMDARDKEKALILEYKSCDPQYGYNRTI